MKIELQALEHAYPGGDKALDGVDLTLDGNEPVAIIGQNGAGKTTLVKHFNGILRPTGGKVLIDGIDVNERSTAEWSRSVGYVFQNPDDQLFLESVRKEFEFGPRQIGMSDQGIAHRVDSIAELVGLTKKLDVHPFDLTPTEKKFCTIGAVIMMRGAKNFVSKAMVAALLAPGKSVLKNVPEIRDVHVVSDLLRLHGVDVDVDGANGIVTIDASRVQLADVADVDTLSGSSRIPILFSGPLVHRLGEAFIPALGGCAIGGRPIDFHLETLRKLGATVDKEHKDGIHITAPNGLHGAKIHLPYPSVGATEQTLLAAVLAEGKTELSGAATEPEIMDLVCVLQKMGAIISVDVDRTFRIEGVKELQGYTHTSLTDRIEAASWASAALATHGDIFVKGATQPEMITFLNVFRKVGGKFEVTDKGIRFWHPGGDLKPVAIETDVHPGFMTDWQQPLVVALTQANGLSIVHETVYENRFGFTKPLVEMGATIQLYRECLGSLPCRFRQRNYKHSAVIFGPTPLTGRDIDVPDLRGGFSHLIAALAASGPSDVHGISLIDRGYADFRGKLEALGADFD